MPENKTKPTNVSVSAFLNEIEDERRRKDSRELVALMRGVTGARMSVHCGGGKLEG
jgi:hypothetical protein